MKRKRKWNQLIGQRIGNWPGTVFGGRGDVADFGHLRERAKCLKRRVLDKIGRLWFASFLLAAWTVWPAVPARADAAQGHLTLDEIIVTEDAASELMGTEVGAKKIEIGKNINIPDVLKSEPDIDIKRRTLIGDTTDSLAIRGFSGNRIMLNIDGRPANASGVVGGYYIDWGTIPLDNIEKIEIIRAAVRSVTATTHWAGSST